MNTTGVVLTSMFAQEVQLTVQGALIMAACIVLVLALNVFCLARILRERHPEEHHHAPLDIDTRDVE